MRRFLCVTVLLLVVAGCSSGPHEVRASSYEQSCSESSECVLVRELEVSSSVCSMGCGDEGVINKGAEADYRRDLDANAKECDGMPGLDCAPSNAVAACVQGKCTRVTPPSLSSGEGPGNP